MAYRRTPLRRERQIEVDADTKEHYIPAIRNAIAATTQAFQARFIDTRGIEGDTATQGGVSKS